MTVLHSGLGWTIRRVGFLHFVEHKSNTLQLIQHKQVEVVGYVVLEQNQHEVKNKNTNK